MKKTLVAMSLLAPMAAHSLGIGDIKLHSALNQKLNAEIALSLTADETISDIKVSLASPNKFDEAGIAWSYFLSTIQFKPILKKNGQVIIQLTSKEVVQEPFLDFLVEVSWPKGDIFKEFTVLVDPPAIFQSPNISAPNAQVTQATLNTGNKQYSSQVDYSRLAVEGQYGPTRRNDSLWKVAKKVNKYHDVSVEQMMIALYKANPGAFYKKNVNALMEGKTLKIPEKPALMGLSKRQANAEFYRQMAVWEGKAVANPEEQIVKQTQHNNQLTLVPPTEESIADADYLAANADDSPKLDLQNQQLQQRLANLEAQFAIMQNMLAIKDRQLAALQNRDIAPEAIEQAPVDGQDEAVPGDDIQGIERIKPDDVEIDTLPVDNANESSQGDDGEEVTTGVESADDNKVVDVLPVTPKQPPVTQTVPLAQKDVSQQESGINYVYLGWGLFGLLALTGIGLLLWRKRQAEEEMNENSMFAASSEIVLPEEDDDEEDAVVPAFDELPSYDVGTVGESSFLSEFTPSDFGVFETDQAEIDPTAETDVYLAYGRYQQAEDLMRQAIADHPDNDDYKLKLLEIFYASENEEGFELFANTLISEGKNTDLNFWSKVSEMGTEIIPNSPLFSSELRESKFEAVDLAVDPLLDDSHVVGVSLEKEVEVEEEEEGVDLGIDDERDNSDIDFDLSSFALTDDSSDKADAPKENTVLDDLDFDLSSFDSVNNEESGTDKENAEIPEGLESFDFDFDTEDKSSTSDDTDIDASQLNADENDDISLDDFDFSTAVDDTDSQDEIKPNIDKQDIPDTEHSSFDFDFEFDEVPEKREAAADSMFEQSDLNLEVSDLTDMDEFETKIDLAKAYVDMGDTDSAKEIAQEVIENGNEAQKKEALAIIEALG